MNLWVLIHEQARGLCPCLRMPQQNMACLLGLLRFLCCEAAHESLEGTGCACRRLEMRQAEASPKAEVSG